ncbi:MAG: formylglycine-generating enzyme family protein, partial [Phycisphaerales bacterium]|nr:formylglycine-generating enzyme family protein [Phycisphaerales bacterium]
TEVSTSQWVEFFNAALDRPSSDRLPFVVAPNFWGATAAAPVNSGGRRFQAVPGGGLSPVGNISWRMAAMYCNWLHNNKRTDRDAFLSGAYDVSTFGFSGVAFTDQAARSPGARFFIPTWDEWLKAAHYDPNKGGQDQGGWWAYSTTSDTAPVGGPPAGFPGTTAPAGQVNAGWRDANGTQYSVPLGAYANVQSPWGLLDAAGGTSEWTEEVLGGAPGDPLNRVYEGSWWTDGPLIADGIWSMGSQFPNVSTFDLGFRIASVVPAPGVGTVCFLGACWMARKQRRR